MLQFEGNSEHSLDPKGRLNIPTRFREVLRDVYGTDMLKITLWKDCLRAYPLPEWEDLMRKLNAGDCAGAAGEFERWVQAGGRKWPGLVKRRKAEEREFAPWCKQ